MTPVTNRFSKKKEHRGKKNYFHREWRHWDYTEVEGIETLRMKALRLKRMKTLRLHWGYLTGVNTEIKSTHRLWERCPN